MGAGAQDQSDLDRAVDTCVSSKNPIGGSDGRLAP